VCVVVVFTSLSLSGGRPPIKMVEAVAQEFGRVLKQYEGVLNTLLYDFASRYISSSFE